MRTLTSIVPALLLVLLSGLLIAPQARAGDEPIVTSDLLKIRTVTSIDVSNDGSVAVFTVRSIAEGAEADSFEYRTHLFALDVLDANAPVRQLTFGRRSDLAPTLSPDGRTVAFLRLSVEDGGEGGGQVWLLPLNGGEARPITDFGRGVGAPIWSPDGKSLLLSSSLGLDDIEGTPPWPLERPGRAWKDTAESAGNKAAEDDGVQPKPDGTREEIRAWLAQNAEDDRPTVITRTRFLAERGLQRAMRFAHLFLVSADAADPVSRDDAVQITRGFYDHGQAAFMPDSSAVVYVKRKQLNEHPDRVLETDLWMVNVDGSDDHLLASYDGWTVRSPKPSLDGSVVAFSAQRTDERGFRQSQLGLATTLPGDDPVDPIWLTDGLDTSVRSFEWMAARGSIVFTTASRGSVPLMLVAPGLVRPTVLLPTGDEPPQGVQAFGVGGGSIVYAVTSPANPSRLMVLSMNKQREAYDPNPWVAEKRLSQPQEAWLDRPDGTRIQYWIMQPTDLQAGTTYPLAVEVHGGPSAMWGPGEASMWHEFQLLCSWGYGIVYCNQRGSGGYGYEFQKSNFQDWGTGPGGDVLAAADQASGLAWVDSDRMVLTGGSYAGYLTAWIVAHDDRFKAAVAQRGVYDLSTFFGEGNAWRLVEMAMGGWPWESNIRPVLQRESPFTHVLRIRTPLLIMHGSEDLRTGVSQSEMLYRALKVLGRPVEYIRYPDTGHELSRSGTPTLRMDRLNRIIEFFERHSGNDRPAPIIQEPVTEAEESASDEQDSDGDEAD